MRWQIPNFNTEPGKSLPGQDTRSSGTPPASCANAWTALVQSLADPFVYISLFTVKTPTFAVGAYQQYKALGVLCAT